MEYGKKHAGKRTVMHKFAIEQPNAFGWVDALVGQGFEMFIAKDNGITCCTIQMACMHNANAHCDCNSSNAPGLVEAFNLPLHNSNAQCKCSM